MSKKNKTATRRDKRIKKSYLSGLTMEEVGEQENMSKERIRQILLTFDIKGKEQIAVRNKEKAQKIKKIIEKNSSISVTEISEKLKYDRNIVHKLIEEHKIKFSGYFKSSEKWTLAMRNLEVGGTFESTYTCKYPRQNFYSKARNAGIKIKTTLLGKNKARIERLPDGHKNSTKNS